MRSKCLVCLLLAGLAYGQAVQPATPPAAGAKADQSASVMPDKGPEVKVGPEDVVITLKGFCADSTLQGDACKTTITREQFEKLAEALQPGMSPAMRRQLANVYSRVVRMSAAAEKRGLDNGPGFDQRMYFARMQVLSQELTTTLQEDSAKVSDADIDDYYKKNEASFVQATFARIFVPHTKQMVNPVVKPKAGATSGAKAKATPAAPAQPTEAQKKAAEDAMTKLADSIRARAAKGEDPDKLQKEAYTAAGLPGNPNTKMEKVRRSTLPVTHQAIMDLLPGAVSEVISDPNSGHYIYVMISKETLTLESVKPEIQKTISSQRYRDSMQGFQGNAELNDAYFGPTRGPGMPPIPRGSRPASQQPQPVDPD